MWTIVYSLTKDRGLNKWAQSIIDITKHISHSYIKQNKLID